MLRIRPRTVTNKQPLMADHNSLQSPRTNQTTPISSFFGSPRFFKKANTTNSETLISPTSILDDSKIFNFGNPFGYFDQNMNKSPKIKNKHFLEKLDSKRIGLAFIDSLNDEKSPQTSNFTTKPDINKSVVFGSKLKIQIPNFAPSSTSPNRSPKSPADFGIKTRNLQFSGDSSPLGILSSGVETDNSPNISTGGLSLSEMELSEEYTCVISHGPNPKTTRIYDNCIVESCGGGVEFSELKNEYDLRSSPSPSFLSFCHTCKKNIGEGKDIYMYRGEKAFCSDECRCEEMLLDGILEFRN